MENTTYEICKRKAKVSGTVEELYNGSRKYKELLKEFEMKYGNEEIRRVKLP